MSNQIEQFLIEFIFKDKDVVKGMKSISEGFEKVNRDSVNKTKKRVTTEVLLIQRSQSQMHNQRLQQEMDLLNLKLKNEAHLAREAAKKAREQKTSKGGGKPVDTTVRNQRMMRRVERTKYFNTLETKDQEYYRGQMKLALDRNDIESFKDIATMAQRNAEKLNAQKKSTISLATAQKGLTDSTRNMLRSYVSLFAIMGGVASINRVGQEFEGLNSAMLAATGTKKEAGRQMAFLTDLSERLGLSLIDTSGAYTKFLFASKGKLTDGQTQELFTSLTELGTTLGVSKERMKLSMNAITQINGLPTR